jgi:hypothetical protein
VEPAFARTVTSTRSPETTPASAPTTLPERTVVDGTFEIERVLGSGGMGVVYLARDLRLQRRVALKLHSTTGGFDVALREAKVMARLNHPNVVTVFEVGAHHDKLFISMEYVEGSTLRGWLERPHRWRDILEMFLAAGAGLIAAHAAGLVHRDFKPDNVLIGSDGRIRVADLGLAQPIGDPTGVSGGTPAYMAPEQHAGDDVGPAADQFAFCVALWEALAGARPFAGKTCAEIAASIMTRPPTPPTRRAVPRAIWRALERGLAVDPSARHAGMDALIAQLRRAAVQRRRRTIAALVGGTVITAATITTILAMPAEDADCGAARKLGRTWNVSRRTAVQGGLAAIGRSKVFEAVAWWSDRWSERWLDERKTACWASDDVTAACLDRLHGEFDELIDVLAGAPSPRLYQTIYGVDGAPETGGAPEGGGVKWATTKLSVLGRMNEAVPDPATCRRTVASTATKAAGDPLEGYWYSNWGDIYFRRVGDQLWGVYSHDRGALVCDQVGADLRCWWSELPSRQPPNDAGEADFRIVEDRGQIRLDSRWRYGADGPWNFDWQLIRAEVGKQPELEARFATPTEFVSHP